MPRLASVTSQALLNVPSVLASVLETYTLSSDKNTVAEGETFTITLTTTNVPDGTNVPYTVTGISIADLSSGSLTGNIQITGNTGTALFTTSVDSTTEAAGETFTFSLDNGEDSINVVILDSSTGTNEALGTLDYVISQTPSASADAGDSSVFFGSSVARDPVITVVGAYAQNDLSNLSSGEAYVYDNLTGALLHTFVNENPDGNASQDQFGRGVALNATHIAIGAPGESLGGKVYLYDRSAYTLVATIDNANPNPARASGDNFGQTIAMSDTHIVIGAPTCENHSTQSGNSVGAAYIFDINTPASPFITGTLNGTADFENLGSAVGINNSFVAVGAYGREINGDFFAGAVEIYDLLGNPIITLVSTQSTVVGQFGFDLDLNEDYLSVVANGSSIVELFRVFDWSSVVRIIINANLNGIPRSVKNVGEIVLVGTEESINGSSSGKILVFLDVGFGSQRMRPTEVVETANFGFAIDADVTGYSVGAPGSPSVADSGRLYIYSADLSAPATQA